MDFYSILPFRPEMGSLVPCWLYTWIMPLICLWVYMYNESTTKKLSAYHNTNTTYENKSYFVTYLLSFLLTYHFLCLQKDHREFTHNEKHGKPPKESRVRNGLYCPWPYVGRMKRIQKPLRINTSKTIWVK